MMRIKNKQYHTFTRQPLVALTAVTLLLVAVLLVSATSPRSAEAAGSVVSARISAGSDDAEEVGPGGSWGNGPGAIYTTSTDLELVADLEPTPNGVQTVGLRFTNLAIPAGATITDAYIQFRAISADSPNSNSGTTNLTITGHDIGSAPTFPGTTSQTYNISNRTRTSASVNWSPGSWSSGSYYDTPNLSAVVQEIVDRGDWNSGQNMAFIIEGSGSRSAYSYNNSSSSAPLLVVEFDDNAPPPTPGSVAACTAPFDNSIYIDGDDCKCENVDSLTVRYIGSGTNVSISSNANTISTTSVSTGDLITVTGLGSETEFTIGGTDQFIHTSCSAPLYPGWLSREDGQDKTENAGPNALLEVVTFSDDNGNEFPLNDAAQCGLGSIGDRTFEGSIIPDDGSEPAIAGVTVDLHGGACPANGVLDPSERIATTVTDASGEYSFNNLIPGEYCVAVNDATAPGSYELQTAKLLDAASQSNTVDTCDFGFEILAEVDVEKIQTSSDPAKVGEEVTYQIRVTNTGPIAIGDLPLADYFDPTYLQFVSASPTESAVDPAGTITWNDLLPGSAELAPGAFIDVVVTFLALQETSGAGVFAPVLRSNAPLAEPVVDGLLDNEYNFVGRVPDGGDAPGNLYQYEGTNQCYYAFVVDRSFNDNVYAEGGEPYPADPAFADGDEYVAFDGWDSHKLGDLLGSDEASFDITGYPDTLKLDYVTKDGNGGFVVDYFDNAPPGSVGATSLLWNLESSNWDGTYPNQSPEDKRYSPPYENNDGVSQGDPDYWEWSMIYEFSVPKSALGGTCGAVTLAGAHNSPDKDDSNLGALGDRVWLDENANGIQDPNEEGIPGVRIDLIQNGQVVRSTVTEPGVSGYYIFSNLEPGTYTVEVVESSLPPGYTITYDFDNGTVSPNGRATYTLPDGATFLDLDFGYVAGQGALGDRVFYDRNGDGLPDDDNDPGLEGVTIELYYEGNLFKTTETDATGFYLFENLPAGDYLVDVVESTLPLPNLSLTTNNEPFSYNLEQDEIFLEADFGYLAQNPGETCDLAIVEGATGVSGGVAPTVADDACTTIDLPEPAIDVTKLLVSDSPVLIGDLITFTIEVENLGPTTITELPLEDYYDPQFLEFVSANPSESSAVPGIVTWDDLTQPPGSDLAPTDSTTVTIVFRALQATSNSGGILAPVNARYLEGGGLDVLADAPAFDLYNLLYNSYSLASTACTAPFDNTIYTDGEDCKCEKPDTLTVRYTGTGPTTITIGGDGSGGPFTNVNTGDVFTISLDGNEPTFTATGQGAQAIHTSCSAPLYPGWTSRPEGDDKNTQGGPFEVVSYSLNGNPFPLSDPQNCNLGSIGDRTFEGTVIPDSGNEPAIGGVTVELHGGSCPANGVLDSADALETRVTNVGGTYSFNDLVPGEYCVTVDDGTTPTNYELATSDPLDAASQSNVVTTCDFGYQLTAVGSIGDRVFEDIDNSGLPDDGIEPGINNVRVDLYDGVCPPSGAIREFQFTSGNGDYLFDELPQGDYCVSVDDTTVPADLALTTANDPLTVNLGFDEDFLDADFGYRRTGDSSIGDRVFYDIDKSGLPDDDGDPGINNVVVNLRLGACVDNGPVIGMRTTAGDGDYLFDNLAADTYCVEVDESTLPAGLTTTTFNNPLDVDLGDNEDFRDADFGYIAESPDETCDLAIADGATDSNGTDVPPDADEACAEVVAPAAIGNYVWVDENEDGLQDAGEPGLPNVVVQLFDATGDLIDELVTDVNGGYLFDELLPGAYQVRVDESTIPANMSQTTNPVNPGADFGNQTQPYSVTVGEGEENLTADFGYNWGNPDENDDLGAIGDRVWTDVDGDGVQDEGEPGIGGVQVTIYYDSNGDGVVEPGVDDPYPDALDQNGNTGGTTTTEPDGSYIFSDLPAGQYVVVVDTPPTGYNQTGDPDHFGTDAGNAPPGTAGDNQTTVPIVLEPGDVFLNADFGYQPDDQVTDTGSIGDTVWLDADGDGTLDPSEEGIPGVTVALAADLNDNGEIDAGEIIATTTTDENGEYLFEGLPLDDGAGDADYLVTVTDSDNVLGELQKTDGPNDGVNGNSQDDPYPVTLDAGSPDDLTADFGYTPFGQEPGKGIIGDTIWFDQDNSGTPTQDPGEPGIEGVVMELYDPGADDTPGTPDDVLLRTTITNENGNYFFGGLPLDDGSGSADYFVKVADSNFDPGGILEGFANTYDPDGNDDSEGPVVTLSAGTPQNLDQDFSYYGDADGPVARIGNLVWEDRNANGVYEPDGKDGIPGTDDDETPFGGVTVDLYRDLNGNGDVDPGEPLLATTVTDPNIIPGDYGADGNYLFDGLPGGDYIVDVTDEDGVLLGYWQSLGDTGVNNNSQIDPYAVSVPTGGENLTADFGYYVDPAALGNRIWEDLDANGIQDPGEPGLPGVPVELVITYPNGEVVTLTTETDEDGNYVFDNLLLDEDYNGVGTPATPGVGGGDEPAFVISVPEDPMGSIPTETNAPGSTDLNDSNDPTGTLATTTQGDNDVTPKPDAANQDPNQDTEAGSYDFGYIFSALGTIGNYVWVDENADGYQDEGEPGIPNVVVELYDSTNTLVMTETTDTDGGYLFTMLPPDDYTVVVDQTTLPEGLTWTGPHVGQVPGADFGNQDPDGYGIDLGVEEEDLSADFGFVWGDPDGNQGNGAIGDYVWVDSDGDGVQDDGEPGIGGVTVTILTDPDGDGVFDTPFTGAVDQNGNTGTGTTTTEPDGSYIFSDLPPDQYVIVVTPPPGYTQTGDPDHFGADASTNPDEAGDNQTTTPIVLDPGDVFLNADFGYQPDDPADDGTIGDTVWLDADADGTLDPSEDGIENVTVALAKDLNNNGEVDPGEIIATTTTDENGEYLFTGLETDDGDGDVDYLVTVTDTDSVLQGLAKTDGPNDGANDNSQDDPYAVSLTPGAPDNLTADFGYTPVGQTPDLGIIGDTIWFDTNNSGTSTPDAGEPGIEGVTVELYSVFGTLLDTTTTNENGTYYFGGLPLDDGFGAPGADYFIKVADSNFDPGGVLEGFSNTYDPNGGGDNTGPLVTLTPAVKQNLDQDFSYYGDADGPVARIGNLVWEDRNANGVYEPDGTDGVPGTQDDETPIGGVTVDLYRDLNGNGVVDPGEPLVSSTVTDPSIIPGDYGADGNYLFDGLPGGDYVVDVTDEDGVLVGYWHSLGAAGVDNNSQTDPYGVSVATGGENLTADFGYYIDPATIGNFVWNDLNGNGIQDPGEPGLSGVEVTLEITYPDGSETTLVTTSGPDGFYSFDNLLLDEDYDGVGTPATPGVGSGDEPYFNLTVETPPDSTATVIGAPGSTDKDDSNDPAGTQAEPIQGQTDVAPQLDPNDEGTNASYDFGFVVDALGTIGNYVWVDENADGFQDEGEPGIPNVVVELYDGTNTLVMTETADANGGYLFTMLPPDNYTVRVDETTLPAGIFWTGPHVGQVPGADFGNQDPAGYAIALAAAEEDLSADFGFVWGDPDGNDGNGAIGDYVWVDSDGDGVQDDNEPGLGGVTVTILTDPDGDGVFDTPFTGAVDQNGNTGTGTTTTEPDGSYIFSDLPPDQYVIVVTPPPGYTQTGDPDHFGADASTNPDEAGDNQTTTPIVLDPGDVFLNADFGYQPDEPDNDGTIGDTVWLDADADGTLDPSEDGIENVTVALAKDLNNNGEVDPGEIIATTTTDENGEYLFTGLETDDGDGDVDYLVTVTDTDNVLGELVKTNGPNDGANDNSQDDPYAVSLTPGAPDNLTADFGYTPEGQTPDLGIIGDTIWFDTNNSGTSTPDAGEPGIEGIVVELYDANGDLVDTTVSDENGTYYFGGLPLDDGIGGPGADYFVKVADSNFDPGGVLEGFYNTYDPDGGNDSTGPTVTLSAGNKENLDQDFSYYGSGPDGNGPVARIGNLVWEDRNANGVYEPNGTDGVPGTQDDETPIGGVTVDLYRDLNGNGVVDPGEPLVSSTVTDPSIIPADYGVDGNYLFDGLPGGDYVVDVTDKDGILLGYWHSLGAAGVDNNSQTDPYGVSVATGGENLTADFGYYIDPAAIGNFSWIDENLDGIQNADELPLADVLITLEITYPNGAVTTLETRTDSNGFYSFGNLLLDEDYDGIGTAATPGVGGGDEPYFKIVAEIPTDFLATITNVGDGLNDSDVHGGTQAMITQGQVDVTPQANPSDEPSNAGYDFGYVEDVPTAVTFRNVSLTTASSATYLLLFVVLLGGTLLLVGRKRAARTGADQAGR